MLFLSPSLFWRPIIFFGSRNPRIVAGPRCKQAHPGPTSIGIGTPGCRLQV
ncbi:hypothetical protein CsSME_00050692 [Camellia sinensis var. sinensis]